MSGCGKIERANWYMWVAKQLESKGYSVECRSMPDPNEAKEKIWIPFMKETLKADEVGCAAAAAVCFSLC